MLTAQLESPVWAQSPVIRVFTIRCCCAEVCHDSQLLQQDGRSIIAAIAAHACSICSKAILCRQYSLGACGRHITLMDGSKLRRTSSEHDSPSVHCRSVKPDLEEVLGMHIWKLQQGLSQQWTFVHQPSAEQHAYA